jgi:hypothetical protein
VKLNLILSYQMELTVRAGTFGAESGHLSLREGPTSESGRSVFQALMADALWQFGCAA